MAGVINTNVVALTCHRIENKALVKTTTVKAEIGVFSKVVYGLPDPLGKYDEKKTVTLQGEFLGCDQFQRNIILKTKNGILQILKDRLLEFKQDHSIVVANGGAPEEIPEATVADVDKVPVAIDETGKTYTSFQDLINDKEGTKDNPLIVNISNDITENIVIPAGKNVIIQFSNGATLKNDPKTPAHTIKISKDASLIITGNGTIDNVTHAKTPIMNNGLLVIKGQIVVTRSKEAGYDSEHNGGNSYYTLINHGSLIIYDGTFLNNGKFSSLLDNGYSNAKSGNEENGYVESVNWEHPSAIIYGGTFIGGINAIKNDDNGILNIKGGTFKGDLCGLLTWNIATIKGGTFTGTELYGISSCGDGGSINQGKLSIQDCIAIGKVKSLNVETSGKPAISGGLFSTDIGNQLPSNYQTVKIGDKWAVTKK